MVALPASPAVVPLGCPNRAPAAARRPPLPTSPFAGDAAAGRAAPLRTGARAAPERRAAPPPPPQQAAQAGGRARTSARRSGSRRATSSRWSPRRRPRPRAGTETPSGSHEVPVEDGKPLEDRYVDDGSVTVEDRKKFSLRAGGTAAGVPVVAGAMPGERMSDAEMMNEIGGSKTGRWPSPASPWPRSSRSCSSRSRARAKSRRQYRPPHRARRHGQDRRGGTAAPAPPKAAEPQAPAAPAEEPLSPRRQGGRSCPRDGAGHRQGALGEAQAAEAHERQEEALAPAQFS